MDPFAPVPPPTAAAMKSATDLYNKLKTTAPTLVHEFDTRYEDWKQTWLNDDDRDSQNSDTRATGPEFEAVLALGPKIMPLVVYQLTSGKDFMAVVLCNELETDELYKLDPKGIITTRSYSGMPISQSIPNLAAVTIIDMNFDRNIDVQDALTRWAEFRVQRQIYSSSGHFCEGEGYWALTTMRSSIIAQVMLEYYNDKSGWWHELLHELVHGRRSGAWVFFKNFLFEQWKDWFEHKEHNDAPEGEDERTRRGHGPGRE